MYAIAFDMDIATLKKTYGEPYNKANNPPTTLGGLFALLHNTITPLLKIPNS